MNIGYARVSTTKQDPGHQVAALAGTGIPDDHFYRRRQEIRGHNGQVTTHGHTRQAHRPVFCATTKDLDCAILLRNSGRTLAEISTRTVLG